MTDNVRPTLNIDVAEFEHYLAECEGTEAEKREYLETLSQLICELVAFGFGIHPVQEVTDCGKDSQTVTDTTLIGTNLLKYDDAKQDGETSNNKDQQEEVSL